ncbi:hypothetical protein [Streptomyces sp. NPDC056982]|uniref:hypothetical protein n=1 Tax=Streptomyces sp. NPDC056982 TaxID=3345986 RepID=UPI003640F2D8
MRRPAQHHPAWSHPYTGLDGLAVFYNDGGDPATPAAPAPAEPPKPGPPPQAPVAYTQEDLVRIAAKEKSQGERAGARKALEDFAAELGFNNIDDAKSFVEAGRKAKQEALSEQERREQEVAEREKKAAELMARAEARERATIREKALARLGATGADLDDALALLERDLRESPDADEATVITAAEALKERRAALFGTTAPATPPVGTLPPAPGGSPAGGPSRTAGSKDNVQARMNALAEKMGYRTKSDAA